MAGSAAYRLVRGELAPTTPPTLDEAQRAAVEHPGGPLLVLAGPGTGKTTTLVEAVARRVALGVDPERLLVLTFSRKAAQELRDRITARLGRTTAAPPAATFHSFCYSLVGAYRPAEDHGVPLRLLSGTEQDVAVRELLAGSVPRGGLAAYGRSLPRHPRPRRGSARRHRAQPRARRRPAGARGGRRRRGAGRLAHARGVRRGVPRRDGRAGGDRLRGVGAPGGHARREPGGARGAAGPLRRGLRRRVPGQRREPGAAAPRDRRRRPRPDGVRRPRPVDLRVPRGRRPRHPRLPGRVPDAVRATGRRPSC